MELRPYEASAPDGKHRLFRDIDAAVTGTKGGIAETKSIILWPTPDEPRLMSLVPPLHIVVLKANDLLDTLDEAIAAQHWADCMPTNALLVSGPSKSADIEQALAFGVHGKGVGGRLM